MLFKKFQFYWEKESGALFIFRYEIYVAVEFLNNQFTDDQPKANTFSVDVLFFIFDWAKEFEKFILIILFDAHSWIYYWYDQFIVISLCNLLNQYHNVAKSIGELDGIGIQIE